MLQIGGQRRIAEPLSLRVELPCTLLDVFSNLLGLPYPVFLDGASGSPWGGRFSYVTADPFMVIRSKGRTVQVDSESGAERREADPFQVLQELLAGFKQLPVAGLPPFQGGAVGYLAYELAHLLERLPSTADDDLALPEMVIGFYDWVIARDHMTDATWLVSTGLPEATRDKAEERLRSIQRSLNQARLRPCPPARTCRPEGLRSNFSRGRYLNAVDAVKDYIAGGDAYQVNISQRFEGPQPCDPWELYLRLRQVNPAPFASYLQFPEVAVLSASPEEYLLVEDGTVQTRPMKGTRPRGRSPQEDRRMAAELMSSEKERAENVMIVDLMRNDLGRVCTPGSIQVPELFTLETHPNVFQMTSTVRGRTRPGIDAVDVLTACFPGGSVTGAPKIRAMEIIDELEPTQRSVYCGAIGYIGFDGSMLTSVPIRIILAKGRRVYFQTGAGIVADSDPQAEYEETLHKAKGSLAALGLDAPYSV